MRNDIEGLTEVKIQNVSKGPIIISFTPIVEAFEKLTRRRVRWQETMLVSIKQIIV